MRRSRWALGLFSVVVAFSAMALGEEPQETTEVRVKVQVAQISLTKVQRLGMDLTLLRGNSKTSTMAGPSGFKVLEAGADLSQLIEALRKDQLIKICEEATLSAANGQPVEYVSPSESSPVRGKASPSERQPGFRVRLTPEMLENRAVRLAFECQLREPSASGPSGPAEETSVQTPSLTVQSGQTVVLTGPVSIRTEAYNVGVPVVSEVPWLGALFRTQREQRNEIQTLVLVRAELVSGNANGGVTQSADGIPTSEPARRTVRPVIYDAPPTGGATDTLRR